MLYTRLAAGLMALTVLLHVIGGGADVHQPLRAALPAPELAAYASVLWHAVTVVLAVLAGGLWVLATRDDPAFEAVLSGIQIGFAGLFVVYGLTRLGTVMAMPQWMLFLALPALTRFGQSRSAPSHRRVV